MFRLAIVATILLAVLGGGPAVSAEEAIIQPRCVCGFPGTAEVLKAGHPIFSDLSNVPAGEGDSGIDEAARTPQTLSRNQHRSYAADPGSTALVVTTRAPVP
jgi:hypothetical protein